METPRGIFVLQLASGVLLACWPLLDTGPTGAVTPLRIGLTGVTLVLLAAALGIAAIRPQRAAWSLTDSAMLACALWYIGRILFAGVGETDPYSLLGGLVVMTAYAFGRVAGTAFLLPAMAVSGVVQAGVAAAQLGGLIASRHSYFDLTGSFLNPGPLGGWLCVAVLAAAVLALQLWKNERKAWAALCAVGGLPIGVALLLTDSRAAWLGFAAGFFCVLCPLKFRYKRLVLLLFAAIAVAGAVFLYGYKKDSADGRLLVWRVSAGMIAERPVVGHGVGRFPECYMFAQGDYFARYPDSRFTRVAEQTSYPFNELIGVACEQGIVGGILLLCLVGSAFRNQGNGDSLALLAGLAVFSLFSYPSASLSFGLLFGSLLSGAAEGSGRGGRRLSPRAAGLMAGGVFLVGGAALGYIYGRRGGLANRYTLVREASALMRRGDAADLPQLAGMARRLPAVDLYTDLGDLCLRSGRAEQAKSYYRMAARMVPGRLTARYGLFRAYVQEGSTDSAALTARSILSKPSRTGSTAALRIRREAAGWLREHGGEAP